MPRSFAEMIKKGEAQRLGKEYIPPGSIKRRPVGSQLGKKGKRTTELGKKAISIAQKGVKLVEK